MLEKTLESPLNSKEIKPVNHRWNQPWVFILRTDAEAEAPVLWPPDAKSQLTGKKPRCWERLRAEGEGGDRGWDGWMASPTQWTWVWETPGESEGQGSLAWQSMGSQRVEHNLATEQQQTLKCCAHLSWLSEDTYSVFIWLAQKQNVFNKQKCQISLFHFYIIYVKLLDSQATLLQ